MKITFLMTGKTDDHYLNEGITRYEKRLKHYVPFISQVIALPKSSKTLSPSEQRSQEAEMILQRLRSDDHVILLDEKGILLSSVDFATYLQKLMNTGVRNCLFVSGGPYGFDQKVNARANDILSLSKMTFTHQMVRLIFSEQLYRAMTILRNEPYHH